MVTALSQGSQRRLYGQDSAPEGVAQPTFMIKKVSSGGNTLVPDSHICCPGCKCG